MVKRMTIGAKIRSLSSTLFFLGVVAATFYPLASAVLFGKSVNESIDSRKVLAASDEIGGGGQTNVFRNAVVSITFDDGWLSTYTNGLPVLDELDIKATFYVLSDSFTDMQYMSIDQVKSLRDRHHEIGSHTVSHPHLTSLDQENLDYEIVSSKKQLESKIGPVDGFASPYGDYDDDILTQIKGLYRYHRTVSPQVNTFENFDKYQLKSPNVLATTPDEDIRQWIERAKKTSGWLILTYHEINDSGREYSISPSRFKEQMKLVKDSGVQIAPVNKVLDEIEDEYGS